MNEGLILRVCQVAIIAASVALACLGWGAPLFAAWGWGAVAVFAAGYFAFEVGVAMVFSIGLRAFWGGRPLNGAILSAIALVGALVTMTVAHLGLEKMLAVVEQPAREAFEADRKERLDDASKDRDTAKAELDKLKHEAAEDAKSARGPKTIDSLRATFKALYSDDEENLKDLNADVDAIEAERFESAFAPWMIWAGAAFVEFFKLVFASTIVFSRRLAESAPAVAKKPARATGLIVRRPWRERVPRAVQKLAPWMAAGTAAVVAAGGMAPSQSSTAEAPRAAVERSHDQPRPPLQAQEQALPQRRLSQAAEVAKSRGRPRRIDAAMLERAQRLREERLSYVEIGERLGIPKSTIFDAMKRAA